MKAGGWKSNKIILLWIFIILVCAISTVAGFSLFSSASAQWLAFIQAFAGGAILMVLANSMIPESYEHGDKLTGIFTVLGFFVSAAMVILETTLLLINLRHNYIGEASYYKNKNHLMFTFLLILTF